MTLHHRTAITCDSPDCTEMVVDDGTSARLIAKQSGWFLARRGGHTVDLCPAHKRTGSES